MLAASPDQYQFVKFVLSGTCPGILFRSPNFDNYRLIQATDITLENWEMKFCTPEGVDLQINPIKKPWPLTLLNLPATSVGSALDNIVNRFQQFIYKEGGEYIGNINPEIPPEEIFNLQNDGLTDTDLLPKINFEFVNSLGILKLDALHECIYVGLYTDPTTLYPVAYGIIDMPQQNCGAIFTQCDKDGNIPPEATDECMFLEDLANMMSCRVLDQRTITRTEEFELLKEFEELWERFTGNWAQAEFYD